MPALHLFIQAKATHPTVQTDVCVRGATRERPGAPARHHAALVGKRRQPPKPAMCTGKPAFDGLAQIGQQTFPLALPRSAPGLVFLAD